MSNGIIFSNKPNPAALNNNKGVVNGSSNGSSEPAVSLGGKACESCNGEYVGVKLLNFHQDFIIPY